MMRLSYVLKMLSVDDVVIVLEWHVDVVTWLKDCHCPMGRWLRRLGRMSRSGTDTDSSAEYDGNSNSNHNARATGIESVRGGRR